MLSWSTLCVSTMRVSIHQVSITCFSRGTLSLASVRSKMWYHAWILRQSIKRWLWLSTRWCGFSFFSRSWSFQYHMVICIVNNLTFDEHTKNIEMEWNYIRGKVLKGIMRFPNIALLKHLLDIFTKGLSTFSKYDIYTKLHILDIYALLEGRVNGLHISPLGPIMYFSLSGIPPSLYKGRRYPPIFLWTLLQ